MPNLFARLRRRGPTGALSAVAFAELLDRRRDIVLRSFVERAPDVVPGARGSSPEYVADHLADVLVEMGAFLRSDGRVAYRHSARLAETHGRQRAAGERYAVSDVRREYALLDEVIREQMPRGRTLDPRAQELYARILSVSLSHATETFVRNSVVEMRARSDELARTETERDGARDLHAWLFELINRVPKPVLLLNRDTRTVWFSNDAAKRMLALDYETERDLALVDGRLVASTPDGRALSIDELPSSRAMRGETIRGEEVVITTPAARHHVRVSAEQLEASYGQPASSVVLIQDISALKATEADLRRQNDKLTEAERSLSAATEVAKVGFFDWDVRRDTFALSEQFRRDWGAGTGLGIADLLRFVHPDDRDRTERHLRDAVASGRHYQAQYRIRRGGTGATRWIDAQGRATRDADGRPVAFFGTTIDVTARKEVESETLAMVNSIPQLAWMADSDGNLFWYNDRWLEFTGTTLEQMRELGWRPFHDPRYLDAAAAKWQDHLDRGESWEDVFPLRGRDGQYRWFLSRAEPIRDLAGDLVRWFGTNTDVTDQLRTERDLARMAAVVESSTDFVGMSDEHLNPVFLNRAARAMVGFGDRDVGGTPMVEFFTPADRDFVEGTVLPTLLKDGSWEGELNFRDFTTGASIPVHYNSFPIRAPRTGELLGYATVTRDITERKRLERGLLDSRDDAERANGAKSAFLANMSHEIRSPLGAIMGFSELLRTGDHSPADVSDFVTVIDRNSKHVLRIIDDILDLSKVEAGKMLIEHIEFSLPELLADFTSLMGMRAREKGIDLELAMRTAIPECIYSDPTRLRQVLNNVVGNAVKFTEKGRVCIAASFAAGTLSFEVSDTGIGLSAAEADSLFSAFNQADASTTRKYGGTGLGLVLTRKLCEALGGGFALSSSEPGAGSTFVASVAVDVPRKVKMVEGSVLAYSTSRATPARPSGDLEGLNVLVVEDSPDNQVLFQLLLGRAGARVRIARDGAEGVAAALGGAFDVVLMDVQMPRMDGHEAVRTLRGKGYRVPIVALTAHAMVDERARAEASGFTDYVSKPVDREHLFAKILTLTRP